MSYRIGKVAELSGFDVTVLRAWERRYELLRPERLENGYRLYSEKDVALLKRVRALLDEGLSIGDVVRRFEEERTGNRGAIAVAPDADSFDDRHPEISWAILDSLPCAVIVTDVHGRVRWVNRGVPTLCGYDLAELRGKTPGSVLQGPGSKPEVRDFLRSAIAERRPCRTQVLNFHKSGQPYVADLEIAPIQLGLRVVGFVGMARRADDIDAAKTRSCGA